MTTTFQSHGNDFETYSQIRTRAGRGRILEMDLRHGLKLIFKDFQFPNTIIQEGDSESKHLAFDFCVSGMSRFTDPLNKGKMIKNCPGHSYLSFCPDPSGKFECLSGDNAVFITAVIEPSQLMPYLQDEPQKFPAQFTAVLNGCDQTPYIHQSSGTPGMQMTAHQILHCPYQGALRRMYLESKTMELITHQLARLKSEDQVGPKQNRLSPNDVERIYEARDILLNNMENPPSLTELSRRVGLNDKKLKYGFKAVFHTTAFGLLRSHRMEQARQLLTRGKMNITQVSWEVGYSERANFSRAFTQHFGCSPQSYLLSLKNSSRQALAPL